MRSLTVAQALAVALSVGLDRLDAHLLLGAALGRPRSWLLAHGEDALDPAQAARFELLCARRTDGEPVAYLLGRKEFYGLDLLVDRNVLVPRPDTETLVDWALELLAAGPPRPTVVDMGTGSGAIALALARVCPAAQVCGVELSQAALEVARSNGRRHELQVEWLHGDWWSALDGRSFDMVVSNPPYIRAGDLHLSALRHEPQLALTPGGDGLGALRILASHARAHLHPGGCLLLEHGDDQAEAVRELLMGNAFTSAITRTDLSGRPRCTAGLLGGHL